MIRFRRFVSLLTAIAAAGTLAAEASVFSVWAETEPDIEETAQENTENDLDEKELAYRKFASRFGDINCDKVIGIADAVMLQRYLLGTSNELNNWNNADLNGNGMIDAVDFTMLKQQLAGSRRSGGTLAVGVVDMKTGESIPGVTVRVGALHETFGYDLGEWVSEKDIVTYYSGPPTDDEYTYLIDCYNLPPEYGNEIGNWNQQMLLKFDGKTDMAVNIRLIRLDTEPNVFVETYDWATTEMMGDGSFCTYGLLEVKDKDGTLVYGRTPYSKFFLPDGEYHVDINLHDYPEQLMDPESEYAAYLKELYPDVTFTDTRNGIDFAVIDGKTDREIRFDFCPPDGKSNSVTVNCRDSVTGLPLEGVEFSLIECPDTYAKTIDTWVSDSTGSHTVTGLLRSGYQWKPPYVVRVNKVPEGYAGGYDQIVCFGYVNDYDQEINYVFTPTSLEKGVTANIINFETGELFNDLTTYEIWHTAPDHQSDMYIVYSGITPGEFVALPDGTYFVATDGRTAYQKGYSGVSLGSKKGQPLKKFFDPDVYFGITDMIDFTVKDGKPDKELKLYVMPNDTDPDSDYTPEQLAHYEELWGNGT